MLIFIFRYDYDFRKKSKAHQIIIFSLSQIKFSRKDKNILATSAYDGNIRIWDINKMKCLKILERTKKV